MSFLARISARAVVARSNSPTIVPKGLGKTPASALARAEGPVEEGELEAQRQTREIAPTRRQEGEEELATLRRQPEEEEEALATLRRQPEEEEGEAMPLRTVVRQEEVPLEESPRPVPPPGQADLEPDAEPVSQELAGEQEPSDLQALHREFSPGPDLLSPPAGQGEAAADGPLAEALTPFQSRIPDIPAGLDVPEIAPPTTRTDETRPTVIIDQLDVLIHEPLASTTRTVLRQDRDRVLRARYLRRL